MERLSEIGRDTLADRFGQAAKDRQTQLHDLARFDIADEQVRSDTRRTFAANRLAGAWLSADRDEARRELAEIRRSVAAVLTETPWKFALWGAVIRAAARRVVATESQRDEDDEEAWDWLAGLLRHVAAHEPDSWMSNWPEELMESHKGTVDWRGPYLSFHRTAFWQSLAKVTRLLTSHHDRWAQGHGTGPSPGHWATRAVPEGRHAEVVAFLGDLDRWARVLYGDDPATVDLRRWELDQLAAACLAATTGRTAATRWQRCDQRVRAIAIPDAIVASAPATKAILARNGRLAKTGRRRRPLGRSIVPQLLLTSGSDDPGAVLLASSVSGMRGADADPNYAIAVAHALRCEHSLTDEVIVTAVRDAPGRFVGDPLALREYERARRIFLSRGMPWPP